MKMEMVLHNHIWLTGSTLDLIELVMQTLIAIHIIMDMHFSFMC